MEKHIPLAQINKNVSEKLLESIRLLDILDELSVCSAKEGTIIAILRKNIKFSFDQISACRRIISFPD